MAGKLSDFRLTRRVVLAGLAAGAAWPALGEAPVRSLRPAAKPAPDATAGFMDAPASMKVNAASPEALIAEAKLGGEVTYVVADAKTGLILEARGEGVPMPPASTAKAITTLYALEHLGATHRFVTRLLVTGPVTGGRIEGDLILAGGGDPTLSTDMLGDMAAALKAAGVVGVTGRFLVWGGALPFVREIDPGQPDWFGYNPSVSGLNLNFNRVHFEWKRGEGGYRVGMDARGERFVPAVYTAKMAVAEREAPLFTYSDAGRLEEWTVARTALGKGGSRWLPVRRPEAYAGDVFQTLARAQGIELPDPEVAAAVPSGARAIVEQPSEGLPEVLRDMMKFSTNLTAEVVGMAASARLGVRDHAGSGRAMTEWLKARTGVSAATFVDHSGLGGASRIAAGEMVQALVRLGRQAGLRGLMKEIRFKEETGKAGPVPVRVDAKTGTLNFVSALSGYITGPDGTEMAFAIFTGDVARRDAVPEAERERPEGGEAWVRRSKRLQQKLIERWAAVYAG